MKFGRKVETVNPRETSSYVALRKEGGVFSTYNHVEYQLKGLDKNFQNMSQPENRTALVGIVNMAERTELKFTNKMSFLLSTVYLLLNLNLLN